MTERVLLRVLFAIVAAPVPLLVFFLGGSWQAVTGVGVTLALLAVPLVGRRRGEGSAPIEPATLGLAFTAALILCILGGQGHFLYANPDWVTRYAVLGDLVRQPWPVVYRVADADWLLRAPLGMYLVPALIGKGLGLVAADVALLAQNVLAFSIIFYFLPSFPSKTKQAALVIGVFCLFSGWDILGTLLNHIVSGRINRSHIEWWDFEFQYSSAITQIFWVPNHSIAGWSFVAVYLCWVRGRAGAGAGFTLAMVPILSFWSPLAALGVLPFAAYVGLKTLILRRFGMVDGVQVALAIASVIPMLLYVTFSAGGVPHGFVSWTPHLFLRYVAFIALEVMPFVLLILWGRPNSLRDPTFLLAVAMLLLLPSYRAGLANDLVMRMSIPALAFLAVMLAQIAAEAVQRSDRKCWLAAGLATLMIGSVTGLIEIRRALRFEAVPLPSCNLVQLMSGGQPEVALAHYIARMDRVPAWLVRAQSPGIPTAPTENCPLPEG